MGHLTEQAQQLVDEFKRRVNALPPGEREEAIREMTESISALNEDAEKMLGIFSDGKSDAGQDGRDSIDNISEFI